MNTQEYNGWTNWETWNVLLWLDNDYNLYKIKQSFITSYFRTSVRNEHKQNFESLVKSFILYMYPNGTKDMTAEDMQKVNYQEIAETWREDYEHENN